MLRKIMIGVAAFVLTAGLPALAINQDAVSGGGSGWGFPKGTNCDLSGLCRFAGGSVDCSSGCTFTNNLPDGAWELTTGDGDSVMITADGQIIGVP